VRVRSLLLTSLLFAGCGTAAAQDRAEVPTTPVPKPRSQAQATQDDPASLSGRHLTAEVISRTWMRRTPNGRKIRLVGQETEFGSRHTLAVTARKDGWLRVHTPVMPNGRSAWIPEHRVTLDSTNFSIHVDRSARRLELRVKDDVVHTMRVAIGRPGNETPLGSFGVTDKITITNPASPYGCCAVALTGHQTKLVPGWIGGDRLAIHGTPVEASVGKPVSLGCLRARGADLRILMRRVPLGTPVFIRA